MLNTTVLWQYARHEAGILLVTITVGRMRHGMKQHGVAL